MTFKTSRSMQRAILLVLPARRWCVIRVQIVCVDGQAPKQCPLSFSEISSIWNQRTDRTSGKHKTPTVNDFLGSCWVVLCTRVNDSGAVHSSACCGCCKLGLRLLNAHTPAQVILLCTGTIPSWLDHRRTWDVWDTAGVTWEATGASRFLCWSVLHLPVLLVWPTWN